METSGGKFAHAIFVFENYLLLFGLILFVGITNLGGMIPSLLLQIYFLPIIYPASLKPAERYFFSSSEYFFLAPGTRPPERIVDPAYIIFILLSAYFEVVWFIAVTSSGPLPYFHGILLPRSYDNALALRLVSGR